MANNSLGVNRASKLGMAWRIKHGFLCQYSAKNCSGVILPSNCSGVLCVFMALLSEILVDCAISILVEIAGFCAETE